MKKITPKFAFTLIELAISLVIIAIIMSVVAGSVKMVYSARLANARSITSKSPVPKIDGLLAWYETSRLESFKSNEAIDDGQISAWYDTSPGSITKKRNTLTRTASSALVYLTNGINKLPSLYLSTETGNISLSSLYQGPSAQVTIFAVVNPYTTMFYNNMTLISSSSGSTAPGLSLGLNLILGTLSDGNWQNYSAANMVGNTNHIVVYYSNKTSSKAFLNDTVNAMTQTSASGTDQFSGVLIGSKNGTCCGFYGLISEIIIYNRPLKSQERRDVMAYLSQKYNIQVTGL